MQSFTYSDFQTRFYSIYRCRGCRRYYRGFSISNVDEDVQARNTKNIQQKGIQLSPNCCNFEPQYADIAVLKN